MTFDGLTETQRAFLSSREHAADFEDLSAVEINKLSFDEWAVRTGQPTMSEIAAHAHGYASGPGTPTPAPQQPAQVQQAVAPEPQGIDVSQLSMEQYSAMRGQLGVQGREYGVGITNSGAGTSDWIAAARAKSGRTGMNESNVQEAARIDGSKYFTRNEPVTGRTSFYRGS